MPTTPLSWRRQDGYFTRSAASTAPCSRRAANDTVDVAVSGWREHSKDRWSVVGGGSGLRVAVMMLAKIHTSAHASKREQVACMLSRMSVGLYTIGPFPAEQGSNTPHSTTSAPAKKPSIVIAPRTEALRGRGASMRHWGGQGRSTATNQSISGPPRSGAKSTSWAPQSCPRGYSESISHLDHFSLPPPTSYDHIYIQLVAPRPERPARTQIRTFGPLQHHQR